MSALLLTWLCGSSFFDRNKVCMYISIAALLCRTCSCNSGWVQACQMVYFRTQNPNLGKFCRVVQWKMLVYFMLIWFILWSFGIFYGHLVYFMVIWYILWSFGIFYGHLVYLCYGNLVSFSRLSLLYKEKSGNPGWVCSSHKNDALFINPMYL
jgi:hypothetical protein